MTEPKENSVSIRISERLLNLMKDAQYMDRKAGKRERSYSEMLEECWISHKETRSDISLSQTTANVVDSNTEIHVKESYKPWVRLLISILDSMQDIVVTAIKQNINAFSLIVGLENGGDNPPTTRKKPRSAGKSESAEETESAIHAAEKAIGRARRVISRPAKSRPRGEGGAE